MQLLASLQGRHLVISPHSDDSDYAMSGTIQKLLATENEIHVLLMCAGNIHFLHSDDVVSSSERIDEFNLAIDRYKQLTNGKITSSFAGFENESRMDAVPQRELVSAIENVQRKVQADCWWIPFQSFHQDHRAIFHASIAACRPSTYTIKMPSSVMAYETVSYQWAPSKELQFSPNLYIDIDEYIDRKIEICRIFKTQIRKGGVYQMDKIRGWAEFRASMFLDIKYCEAFQVLRISS